MLNTNVSGTDCLLVKKFFDGIFFPFINDYFFADSEASYFPQFLPLQKMVERLNIPYFFYFSVFKLGQSADESYIRRFIPDTEFRLMQAMGILVKEEGEWRTPGLTLYSLNGCYIFMPSPVSYPTSKDQHIYSDFKFTNFINSLSFVGPTNLLYISNGCYGLPVIQFCKSTGMRATLLVNDERSRDLIELNIKLNQLSDSISVISSLEDEAIRGQLFNVCVITPNSSIDTLHSSDMGLKVLIDLAVGVNSIPLSKDANVYILYHTIGNRTEIPDLRTHATQIKHEMGMYSQILVLEKSVPVAYFDALFKTTLPLWNDVAGYKASHYESVRNKWFQDCKLHDHETKYIYKILCKLSFSEPEFEFLTMYQPNNTDPLYTVSTNAYKR